jgi:hypothetical protein
LENLLQNNLANFHQTLQKSFLGEGDSCLCNEEDNPSPRGDNTERVKIHKNYSNFLYLLNLHNQNPWVKGIQVCSFKGSGPLQRGDNHKNVKMGWGHLKILFLKIMKPENRNFI